MWKKLNAIDLPNSCELFNGRWPLLTAGSLDDANTMTISWGGVAYLWNTPQIMCVVRPQRHTLKYLKRQEYFSLSILDTQYKDILTYLGRTSGAVENKIEKAKLNLCQFDGSVAFEEANMVIVLKKTYVDQLKKEGFINPELADKTYPSGDFHYVFYGEIVAIYCKEN